MKIIDERELFEIKKDDCLEFIVLAMNLREALECIFKSHFSEDTEDDNISGRKLTVMECNRLKTEEEGNTIDYIRENIQEGSIEAVIIDYTEF